ncbi:hypothetical protein ACI6QG_04980 [Roseococcus sp. DSY-14]
MTEEPMDKVDARQGDKRRMNSRVLVWGLALVIAAFVIGYFIA